MKIYLLKQKPGPGMSKRMFDALARELNLPLEYQNLVTPEDYYDKVLARLMKDDQVIGFNVTIPYKVRIRKDVLADEDVEACGAVNCVRVDHQKGVFYGYNTDWKGIYKPLQSKQVQSAIVAGAGGAARAAVYALDKMGVKSVHLFNRTKKTAESIREIFPIVQVHNLDTLDDFLKKEKTDLLINSTSLGMNPAPRTCLPVSVEGLKNCRIVFDIVYKPLKTKLLTLSEAAGCDCINGLQMLVQQHGENVKIWNLPKQEEIVAFLNRFKKP